MTTRESTRKPTHGHSVKGQGRDHAGEPTSGHTLKSTDGHGTGHARMNTDEPTGVDMATTAGWRFGGKWALAGVATTVLAIEVFTVQKVLYATGCALVLAYAAGVAVGWRMRRHGNGR